MLKLKINLIAIAIGVGGAWATDLLLNQFNLSKELHHLIGSTVVYFFGTIYILLLFIKDDKQNYFSRFTLLWIVTDLLVIALRLCLYNIGIIPSLTGISNILLLIMVGVIWIVVSVFAESILKIGGFEADNSFKK